MKKKSLNRKKFETILRTLWIDFDMDPGPSIWLIDGLINGRGHPGDAMFSNSSWNEDMEAAPGDPRGLGVVGWEECLADGFGVSDRSFSLWEEVFDCWLASSKMPGGGPIDERPSLRPSFGGCAPGGICCCMPGCSWACLYKCEGIWAYVPGG